MSEWQTMMRDTIFQSPTSKRQLAVLGLDGEASWDDIVRAHRRLSSDLTPGPGASHRNVEPALAMLAEVDEAYHSLSVRRVA